METNAPKRRDNKKSLRVKVISLGNAEVGKVSENEPTLAVSSALVRFIHFANYRSFAVHRWRCLSVFKVVHNKKNCSLLWYCQEKTNGYLFLIVSFLYQFSTVPTKVVWIVSLLRNGAVFFFYCTNSPFLCCVALSELHHQALLWEEVRAQVPRHYWNRLWRHQVSLRDLYITQ